jgi:hypothetical protein
MFKVVTSAVGNSRLSDELTQPVHARENFLQKRGFECTLSPK